jgi:hypothetical protein
MVCHMLSAIAEDPNRVANNAATKTTAFLVSFIAILLSVIDTLYIGI